MHAALFLFMATACFLPLSGATSPEPYYRNVIARTLGDRNFQTDFYRWICDYVTPETVFPSAVVSEPAPAGAADTYARYVQMVRCHDAVRSHFRLNAVCARDPHEWRRIAAREIRRCLHAPLSAAERGIKGAFADKFSRDACDTTFGARRDTSTSQAVLLCLCNQKQFKTSFPEIAPVVSVGSARFSTLGSRAGSAKELKALQGCIESELPGISEACGSPQQNFNVLGRHLMEACCKRVRVELKDSKFECKELVPDDLTILNASL